MILSFPTGKLGLCIVCLVAISDLTGKWLILSGGCILHLSCFLLLPSLFRPVASNMNNYCLTMGFPTCSTFCLLPTVRIVQLLESNTSAPWDSIITRVRICRPVGRLLLVMENKCAKLRGFRGRAPKNLSLFVGLFRFWGLVYFVFRLIYLIFFLLGRVFILTFFG